MTDINWKAVTWIIDSSIDPIENSMTNCLSSLNKKVFSFNGGYLADNSHLKIKTTPTDLKICRGSIQSINRIIKDRHTWITFYDKEKYNCDKYYPYFNDYLLNDNFVLMPFGIVLKNQQFLYETFNGLKGESLFFRPNSGNKVFTGKSIHYEEFSYSLQVEKQCYNVSPEELILIAPHRTLEEEWRVIVGCIDDNNSILSSSSYRKEGENIEEEGCPEEVKNFALEILNNTDYKPHMVFAMDIAKTSMDELKLIEINAFSTCGLYKCKLEPIVEFIEENLHKQYISPSYIQRDFGGKPSDFGE